MQLFLFAFNIYITKIKKNWILESLLYFANTYFLYVHLCYQIEQPAI